MFGGRSIGEELFNKIRDVLPEGSTIIEFGSGEGTKELSKYYNVYSVEHDKNFLRDDLGATQIYAPLVDYDRYTWYDEEVLLKELPTIYHAVIIDGPPQSIGREGIIPFIENHMNTNCLYVVDDTHREKDKELLDVILNIRKEKFGDAEWSHIEQSDKMSTIIYPQEIGFAMTIAPRENPTYNETIKSLRDSGYQGLIHIFAEPGYYEIEDDNTILNVNREKLGIKDNTNQAIQFMLGIDRSGYFAILQDDMVFTKEGYSTLWKSIHLCRDAGYMSTYTPVYFASICKIPFKDGWNDIDKDVDIRGANFVFSSQGAQRLLRDSEYSSHKESHGIDVGIGRAVYNAGKKRLYHYPSLTNHIGYTSTVGHKHTDANEGLGLS